MKARSLQIQLLPLAAVVLLVAGLVLAGLAVREALTLKGRLTRRAAERASVRELAERWQERVESPGRTLAAAEAPADFQSLFIKVFPEGNWASSISSREEASDAWDLLRVTVTVTDVPLQQVGALITTAGLRPPPWRLREARLQSGDVPGKGSATLTFEAPERRGGKAKTP